MDFLTNMNNALNYIEENLNKEIDYEELATIALCPVGTFQRFFVYATGMSLSEYVRKRCLTNAALDLQKTDSKVIDVAVKYGYESQSSFTRAFQNVHGVSPKQVRDGASVKAYSKLHFHFSIKGDVALNYKIEEKPYFQMTGIRRRLTKEKQTDGKRMIELWNSLKDQRRNLSDISSEPEKYVYGVTRYIDENTFDYYIAIISDHKKINEDSKSVDESKLEKVVFPSSKWAVFKCEGSLPDSQINTWRQIFTEWLPFSGFSLADIPEVEWYSEGNIFSDNYESEIWIPVE